MLRGPVLEIERYVNLHLTRAEKGDLRNWRYGDVAAFHHDVHGIGGTGVRSGDACRIAEVGDVPVVLDHPDGRRMRIDPSGRLRYRLDLFEGRMIELRAGDRIRRTGNDRDRNLVNGGLAEVASIGPSKVRFRTPEGDLAMARDDPQLHHLDHAYSSTVHAAQGMTCDRVIAVLDSDGGPPADRAMFYVGLTRARDNVMPAMAAARTDEAVAPTQPGQRVPAPLPGSERLAERRIAQTPHPGCNLEPHCRDLIHAKCKTDISLRQ